MTLAPSFHINGFSYSRSELEAYSQLVSGDERQPDWSRKLFAFINNFLDESVALEQRSSGTTGDPKVFEMDREAMLNSARLTLDFFGLHPGDRVLLGLSVDYIAGKMLVVRALSGGLDLVLTEPSSRPLEGVEGDFSLVPMVPLQVIASMEAGDDLAPCGKLLIGGGALEEETREKLSLLQAPEVWASFGMSETYTHFALQRINGPEPQKIFKCLPEVKIGLDARACLKVDVPGITKGPVQTSDLVEIYADGLSFRWLGRYDNVIKSGGIKIIPEILEEKISAILGTAVLLLPLPHEKLGQKLVLVVESAEKDFRPEEWKEMLKSVLVSHEIPRHYHRVNKLPRNSSMKPDRRAAVDLLLKS